MLICVMVALLYMLKRSLRCFSVWKRLYRFNVGYGMACSGRLLELIYYVFYKDFAMLIYYSRGVSYACVCFMLMRSEYAYMLERMLKIRRGCVACSGRGGVEEGGG